jgi:hypothetical protein
VRAVGRAIAKVLSFIDELVALAFLLAGLALAVVVGTGGGSAVQVGLVLVLTAAVTGWWTYTSNAGDWFKRRE